MISRSFGVEFFGFLRYRIMSSANRDSLTVSLPICIPFISSSCLIALARNSSSMLNRSEDHGHPCLIPDFRGNGFSFSPVSMVLAVSLSCIAFIILSYFLPIPSYLRAFIMKWCWILLKAFSTSIEMIKGFLSLFLLMCCIALIDLRKLNHPCIPGMKLTWSW
jgi:hypothetical protein